jgi:hypothetical protein
VQSLLAAPLTVQRLLAELQHADTIIKTMLNAMTIQQKVKVGAQLEAAGIAGEGVTRHHERRAAIDAANAAAPTPQALSLNQVERRLLDAFRTMDRRAKSEALVFVELRARDHPEPPPPPMLRLVSGGVK